MVILADSKQQNVPPYTGDKGALVGYCRAAAEENMTQVERRNDAKRKAGKVPSIDRTNHSRPVNQCHSLMCTQFHW